MAKDWRLSLGPVLAAVFWASAAAAQVSPAACVRRALEAHPDIRNARLAVEQGRYDEVRLLGRYVPQLTGSFVAAEIDEPVWANPFNQFPIRSLTFSPSLGVGLPGGGFLSAGWQAQSAESKAVLGPGRVESETRKLTLSYVQPLLRDLLPFPSDLNLMKVAASGRRMARLALEQAEQNLAYAVLTAYFNLLIADLNVTVRSNSLERARRLLALNERNRGLGIVDETDLLAGRAVLALRTAELEQARQVRADLAENLRLLMTCPDPEGVRVDPAAEERFQQLAETERDEAEAVSSALSNRVELRLLREQVRMQRVQLAVLRSRTLPQLNLTASWSLYGNTNTAAGALRILGTGRHDSWTAGLTWTVPLPAVAEGAELRKQRLELERLENNLRRLEDQVASQVRTRLRELRTLRRRQEEILRAVEFQREKLRREEEKHRTGRSSTRLLIQYQDDLENAETLALQVRLQYDLALAGLAFAEGRLMEMVRRMEAVERGGAR